MLKIKGKKLLKTFILQRFQYKFTIMKATPKIAFLFLYMLIFLSWGINCVAPIFETNTEKNIQDKRVALPGSESDVEEKTFELVHESLPSYDIPFVTLNCD